MKLIKPSVELYLQEYSSLEGIYKQIERCARVSYKSEDKITEDSSKEFVDRLIKSGHLSPLEHGTVYLKFNKEQEEEYIWEPVFYDNPYSTIYLYDSNFYYATTNYRTIVENNWEDCLQHICAPTEYHRKRLSLKFNTDIGVTRECNRHRTFSTTEMSTRYCNFSKDKFDNELTYIIPSWLDIPEGGYYYIDGDWYNSNKELKNIDNNCLHWFLSSLYAMERNYMILIENGWTPQQAREILPLATKTEVVYTGFESDWKHFFDLRLKGTTGAPHPNCKQIAQLAWDKLKEIGYEL